MDNKMEEVKTEMTELGKDMSEREISKKRRINDKALEGE